MAKDRLSDLYELPTQAIEEAYKRGYADARKAMLEFVKLPGADVGDEDDSTVAQPAKGSKRAPKGLLRKLTKEILARHPGLSMSDLEKHIEAADSRVSPRSVGTELRRGEQDGIYERQEGLWYLAGQSPEAKSDPFSDTFEGLG